MRFLSRYLLLTLLALPGCCCGGVVPVGHTSEASPSVAPGKASVAAGTVSSGAALAAQRRTAL